MTQPVVGVGAVVVHDGRLLVIQRGHAPAAGYWSLPGGRLRSNELLDEGVLRELREETGLDGRVTGLCGIAERMGEDYHFVILDFFVEVDALHEPTPGDDADDARWVTRGELMALERVPLLEEFLAEHAVLDLLAD